MRTARIPALFTLGAFVVLAVAGCPQKEEDITVSTSPTVVAPAPTPTPTDPAAQPVQPPTPTPPVVNPTPVTQPKIDAGIVLDAGTTPTDAGTTTTSDAGTGAQAGAAACLAKCGGVAAACLTPVINDAGMPQVKDPAACNAAAEACRKACGGT